MNLRNNDISDRKFQKDLNAGIAALVLLNVLSRATEPMYGYQIAKLIKEGDSTIKQGTLYPVLRTLEGSGLLESEVEPSVSGPPRRYYQITEAGRDTLKRWHRIWKQTKVLVDTVAEGTKEVGNNEFIQKNATIDWKNIAPRLVRVLKPNGQLLMSECRLCHPEYFNAIESSGLLFCIADKGRWAEHVSFEELPDYSTAELSEAFGDSLTDKFSLEADGWLLFWGYKK